MKIKRLNNFLGWDGVLTLILSNCFIFLSFGTSLLWYVRQVYLTAKSSHTVAKDSDLNGSDVQFILIPGMKLTDNTINSDFTLRLNRAIKLSNQHKHQLQLIVLGGITGNNSISEADAGAKYLFKQQVDKNSVTLECQSKHTLDNLRNARNIIAGSISLMVTNRYHLYRANSLAKGLQLNIMAIAAEDEFEFSIKTIIKCFKEAYFVHWYFFGKLWVIITKNKSSQDRIS